MKIAKHINIKFVNNLPDGSYLAKINGIIVRVIDVKIKGFRSFILITNLTNPDISAKNIVKHYYKRWDTEISYDEVKTHQFANLKGVVLTILRSKKADLMEQELYALLISYNMTRWLMFQATSKSNSNPLEISFLDSLQWIITAFDKINAYDYLLKLIEESAIGKPRRNRANPRVIKVTTSKFSKKTEKDKGININFCSASEEITNIISPSNEECRQLSLPFYEVV